MFPLGCKHTLNSPLVISHVTTVLCTHNSVNKDWTSLLFWCLILVISVNTQWYISLETSTLKMLLVRIISPIMVCVVSLNQDWFSLSMCVLHCYSEKDPNGLKKIQQFSRHVCSKRSLKSTLYFFIIHSCVTGITAAMQQSLGLLILCICIQACSQESVR